MIDNSLTQYSTDKKLQDFQTTGTVNLSNNTLTGLKPAVSETDAPTYLQLTTGLATKYNTTVTLNNIAKATGSVDLNGQKITGLADPVLGSDAVNKTYAD